MEQIVPVASKKDRPQHAQRKPRTAEARTEYQTKRLLKLEKYSSEQLKQAVVTAEEKAIKLEREVGLLWRSREGLQRKCKTLTAQLEQSKKEYKELEAIASVRRNGGKHISTHAAYTMALLRSQSGTTSARTTIRMTTGSQLEGGCSEGSQKIVIRHEHKAAKAKRTRAQIYFGVIAEAEATMDDVKAIVDIVDVDALVDVDAIVDGVGEEVYNLYQSNLI